MDENAVDKSSDPKSYGSFDEFFAYYLREHSDPRNRRLHAVGTLLGLVIVIAAFVARHPWFALLWIPVSYSCAWLGHFLLEHNRPATFRHPWWSFLSDFRMLYLMAARRLPGTLDVQTGKTHKDQ